MIRTHEGTRPADLQSASFSHLDTYAEKDAAARVALADFLVMSQVSLSYSIAALNIIQKIPCILVFSSLRRSLAYTSGVET